MAINDYNQSDVNFVRMMIPHHQQAVDESAKAFHAAKSPDVKEWTRTIWNTQKAEIEKFRKWLKDRGLAEKGGGMAAKR